MVIVSHCCQLVLSNAVCAHLLCESLRRVFNPLARCMQLGAQALAARQARQQLVRVNEARELERAMLHSRVQTAVQELEALQRESEVQVIKALIKQHGHVS